MSGNPLFTLERENAIVVDLSGRSTHLFSATLVEQGSVLDHFHRPGGCRGRCAPMLVMIG